MLFPYIIDYNCVDKSELILNRSNNQPKRKPKENVCRYEFDSNYHFVKTMCPLTFTMELKEQGSSAVPNDTLICTEESLPTSPDDDFSDDILSAYICREIYHACVLDREHKGPFCFIYRIINYIKKVMRNAHRADLNANIKKKIFDLITSMELEETDLTNSSWLFSKHTDETTNGRAVNSEDDEFIEEQYLIQDFGLTKELLIHSNSHLIYAKRWLSIIESFLKVKRDQSKGMEKIQNFMESFQVYIDNPEAKDEDETCGIKVELPIATDDNIKKRDNKIYQRERATALSAINRVQQSYITRFQSWWSTAENTLKNPIVMQTALRNGLMTVFGLKSALRPGFSLVTNYRFDTDQQVLTRPILNALYTITNKRNAVSRVDDELQQICDDFKVCMEWNYNHAEEITPQNVFGRRHELGINYVQIQNTFKSDERVSKNQALKRNALENKRVREPDFDPELSQIKKIKRDLTLMLNSEIFSRASVVNVVVPLTEEQETENDLKTETTTTESADNEKCGSSANVQVNCYQETTRITTDECHDEEIIDNFIDDKFISHQSKVAIDLLENENGKGYFVSQLNVLVNTLGL